MACAKTSGPPPRRSSKILVWLHIGSSILLKQHPYRQKRVPYLPVPHAYSLHEDGAAQHVRPDAHDMRKEERAWLHIESSIDQACTTPTCLDSTQVHMGL